MAKRKKKRSDRYNKQTNAHHLCWQRRHWSNGYAKALRNHWFFIVEIPAGTLHRTIHEKMNEIPVPNPAAAKEAYEQVMLLERAHALRQDADVETRLRLLIALFDCSSQHTADAFKKQLRIVHEFNKAPP